MSKNYLLKSILIFTLSAAGIFLLNFQNQAQAGIDIDYPNYNLGKPIFEETNWAPGDQISKKVTLINHDPQVRSIKLIVPQEPSGKLANELEITITDNQGYFYGPETLKKFYSDTPLNFPDLAANATKDYYFKIEFNSNAGNEYQGETTTFDLHFYFEGNVTETITKTEFPGPRGDGTLDLPTPAEFLPQVKAVATHAITAVKKIPGAVKLPPRLPRVGAWGGLIAASMGLIATVAVHRRNKK